MEFRKAAEISNRVEDARQATEIGFVYGFNDDALASAERWLELSDDSEEAQLYVARIQMRRGEYGAARRGFKRLITGDEAERPVARIDQCPRRRGSCGQRPHHAFADQAL